MKLIVVYLSIAIGSSICYSSSESLALTAKNADNTMYSTKLLQRSSTRHAIISALKSTLTVRVKH